MRKWLLAIFDIEESYTQNMIHYLSNKKNFFFEVKGFTNLQEFICFCNTTIIDLLLVSKNDWNPMNRNINIQQIVLLGDTSIGNNEPYPMINKYQSAENVIKELLEYCPFTKESNETPLITNKETDVIGIYSPINGCGKTSFALTLAHLYSKLHPTLYINVEEFSGLYSLLENSFPIDLSDLFYFYKQALDKFSTKLISSIQSLYEIDYIPPTIYSYDLRNIEANDWKGFFTQIFSCSKYEVIIIDLSNMVKDIYAVLDLCKILYMPIKSDRISKAKLFEFEEFIKNTNREEFLSKIRKLEIPVELFCQSNENFIENLVASPLIHYVKNYVIESVE